jgi:hypothetical protein
MLAKKTVKNQLTLPKAVISRFADVEYFDVTTDGSAIILRPLKLSRSDEVHERMAEMGITEKDVQDAIAWSRESK